MFLSVPCASFDTDAGGGSTRLFCFIFRPLVERERETEEGNMAGRSYVYLLQQFPLLSLLTFFCVGVVAWMFSFVYNGEGAGPRLLVY